MQHHLLVALEVQAFRAVHPFPEDPAGLEGQVRREVLKRTFTNAII